MNETSVFADHPQGEELARLFERTIHLTQEMARLQVRDMKLQPLRRAGVALNLIALPLLIISFFETTRFPLSWQLGMTFNLISLGLLAQTILAMRRINKRGRQIVTEMTQINERLQELKHER